MTGGGARLTTVCRLAAHHRDPIVPGEPHAPCTGCDCDCHHVPPPHGFRHLVDHYRRHNAEEKP
ncbi:MAG TPA: hypothetical protein PLX07_16280 [Microthrixaceae bacterium]|nr:hypothetical protein [Microthrixaceae bacterium]